jgi:hypothetical protein
MNRKQFITLIVVGLLVGGLGLFFSSKRKQSFTSSSFDKDRRVLENFPLNDVAQLRIREGTNEVNLARGEQGWGVKERHDYPANFADIGEFLRKSWELKPVQDVEVGASQFGRLQLLNPAEKQDVTNSGTLVEYKGGNGAVLKTLILGKMQTRQSEAGPFGGGGGEFPVGRYVLAPGDQAKVWLVSETFSNIETKPEQWLNKDFFKVEKIRSVAVTAPNPTNTWTIARESESGEWKMTEVPDGQKFEASKASSLNYLLSSPSFNDVAAPEPKIEDSALLATTKVETFDGFAYTFNIGGNTNDENLLLTINVAGNFEKERPPGKDEKPEDKEKLDKEFKDKLEKLQEKLKNEQKFEKWTYRVSKWTVDALLKPRTDFFAEKKEESAEPSANSSDAPPVPVLPDELKNIIPPPPLP